MEEVKTQQEIDFDVANALYLISSKLGQQYEKDKISPFAENFKLSEGFVKEVLESTKDKSKIIEKQFLKMGNKEASKNFSLALENVQEIIKALSDKLYSGEFALAEKDNFEAEIMEIIELLKARKKLLEIAIQMLKNSQTNAYELYCDIVSFSKRIENLLENSFEEKIELQVIIQKFIEECKKQSKKVSKRTKIIEKNIDEKTNNLETEKELDKQAESFKQQEILRQQAIINQQLKQEEKQEENNQKNENENTF